MNAKQYSIKLEHCGYSVPLYVVRFNGKAIGGATWKHKAEYIVDTHKAQHKTTLNGE